MTISSSRIWRFLPNWLKTKPPLDTNGRATFIWAICAAAGAALDAVTATLLKMRARGLATRAYPSEYPSYYLSDPHNPTSDPSEDRKDDLYLIGAGRGQYKRPGETWAAFELRLQQFAADVRDFGTVRGLERELGRLGFGVEYWQDEDETDRWILLDQADQCREPETNISHIFAAESDPLVESDPSDLEDPSVRGTRIFDGDDELWSFNLRLTVASAPPAASTSEIRDIIRRLKPAYTRCWLFLPSHQYALEVL